MSSTVIRRAVIAVGAAVALGSMAVPSAAADGRSTTATADAQGAWHCKTKTRTIDDPSEDGGPLDNHDFTIKVCSKRVGAKVYGKSKIAFDINHSSWNPADGARLRTYVKKSRSGPDPVRCYRTSRDFSDDMTPPDEDGRYTAKGVGCRVSKYGRADVALKMDWTGDGRGYRTYKFPAAPRV